MKISMKINLNGLEHGESFVFKNNKYLKTTGVENGKVLCVNITDFSDKYGELVRLSPETLVIV